MRIFTALGLNKAGLFARSADGKDTGKIGEGFIKAMKQENKKIYNLINTLSGRILDLTCSSVKKAKKALKTFHKIPPAEDVLYIILFGFSVIFGASLLGINEKINNENFSPVASRVPNKIERDIRRMAVGYPIIGMAQYISSQDKDVAAYLVAIAKKESNWGKFSPQKDGKSCYNYWGYRGTYNQTQSGYSCFDSPKQAVKVVGERLAELIEQDINTPQKMVVWKCGRNCLQHSSYSVDKWIQDVDLYYRKF